MNIYILKTEGQSLYKLGIAENVKRIVSQISTNSPFKLSIILEIELKNAAYIEQILHEKYKDYNTNREWFELSEDKLLELKKDIVLLSSEVEPKDILIKWLNKYKHIFSLRALEKELGIPAYTLQKFSQGKQGIPNKWIPIIYNFLIKMFGSL